MDSAEVQARALLAAALIVRGVVEVPSLPAGEAAAFPAGSEWVNDPAAMRLRELTDYLYRTITAPEPRVPNGTELDR